MNLQAIVFDFDGVIANSEPLHLKAYQEALADAGLFLGAEEYYARYLGYDDIGAFEAIARDRGLPWDGRHVDELVIRKGLKLQEMLHEGAVLYPGASDFIRAAAASVPVAIASGALRREIDEIIEAAGLARLFTCIVASGDTAESKPSPAPYRLAFELMCAATGRALARTRCVAIEDSKWGLESAWAAGLRCVGVTTSYGAEDLPRAELLAGGLGSLTLTALDALVGDAPGSR